MRCVGRGGVLRWTRICWEPRWHARRKATEPRREMKCMARSVLSLTSQPFLLSRLKSSSAISISMPGFWIVRRAIWSRAQPGAGDSLFSVTFSMRACAHGNPPV